MRRERNSRMVGLCSTMIAARTTSGEHSEATRDMREGRYTVEYCSWCIHSYVNAYRYARGQAGKTRMKVAYNAA